MYHFSPPITNRKIRFALVGCGRIAQNHFASIKHHESRAELVGVCDIDSAALDAAVKTTGAKPYKTLSEMLAACDADAFLGTVQEATNVSSAGSTCSVISDDEMIPI
jgi:UDP-N-acetyl-2-amino-2-deoxyglucuronate dehydrogenase